MWLLRGRSPERRAERRELEERNRQQWERTSRSFARAAVCCSRQARWSEPRVPPRSAVAERRERLEERRERLRRLLREEREALSAELRERRRGGMRSEEPRGGREERGTKVAERLLQEHWKENNTELQEAESQLHKKHVIEAWGDQLTNKNKEEVTELEEKKCYENKYEMARREELERVRQEEEKHQLEKKNQAEMLLQQIEELKLQEAETKKLKKERENLLKQQWELENLEEERKQMEEHRRQKEFGRFLRHQCGAQLKRRAQQIQEELETDRQILSALLERENENHLRQLGCREQAVADVAWMKRVIEEQLQLEKEREAELETLFTEEAKKVWEMMKGEWEREKVARDRLMNEVFAGRQRQIQEKIKLNRRAQEETLKYREQLIRELEEAKELSRREKEQEEELKTAHRQELEAQGTERRWQEEEEQWREEEKEERWARQRHKELVQREGERRVYSYPKAPWT
ncbi:trichoplein keratin filament-binding protein [Chiroxiphia lanceolata]|uniref:trichoplein keratin filament-binding protein n=1 Tax=Chiroxiphia lanceolata TaxID=296741 RepID=UPI0013CE62E2|nr:trichoplein keratin filament-binding protein [Chiroxiphia lanceolata]